MLGAKLLVVAALLAVVLTIVASPILIGLYRRRISFWMRAGRDKTGTAGDLDDTSCPAPEETPPTIAWSFPDLRARAVTPSRHPLVVAARSRMERVAVAYAAGGLVHAVLLTWVFWFTHQSLWSTGALIGGLTVFALPVLVTVLYLLTASRTIWACVIGGALLAAYVLLGEQRGSLVLLIFVGQLLVPAVIFLLFNLRFWRGVAPLLLVVLAFASLFWVLGAELARASLDEVTPALWAGRIGGFAVGAWIGYWALTGLRSLNSAGWLSDQELFLDTWWFLYTVIQTVIYVLASGPELFAVLLLFPAYFVAKRLGFAVLGVRELRGRPLRLLLLRVFGFDARTERLFDHLDRQWRFVGRIELIAGRDLAARNVGPLEFADFLAARLRRHFLTSIDDLRTRLAALGDRPDPDGRFRAEHFYCQENTWRPAMRALAGDSDIVLMDLRGFGRSNEGAKYELRHLARTAPRKPVVLLADERTDLAGVGELIGAREPRPGEATQGTWQVVRAAGAGKESGGRLMALLAGALNHDKGGRQ